MGILKLLSICAKKKIVSTPLCESTLWNRAIAKNLYCIFYIYIFFVFLFCEVDYNNKGGNKYPYNPLEFNRKKIRNNFHG